MTTPTRATAPRPSGLRRRGPVQGATRRRVAAALALALPALLAGPARAAGPNRPAAEADAPIDFSHSRHVPPSWLFPQDEVQRDCRGCHDFSNEDPARWPSPTDACTDCHVFGSFEFQGEPASDPTRFPQHFAHWRLNCSTCHAVSEDLDDVPKFMPVPVRDGGYCIRCHAERNSMGDRAEQDRQIAADIAARGDTPGRFLHSQHLAADQRTDGATCQRCHKKIASSDAGNLGEKQFDPKSCSECHTAEFEVETYLRPSKTAAAFWHEVHLGSKALRIEEKLAGKRCAACHVYDEELQNYRLADFFLATGDTHDGCVTCHEHESWRVENHGETDECAQCHALQGGSLTAMAGMATNRPTAQLLRPRPVGFRFGEHEHPLITTGSGNAVDESCQKCHRADVPALPSMLESRPFDHASHLSADPGDLSAADCRRCHEAIAGEAFNRLEDQREAARIPDADPTLIYEDTSCARCHGGDFETVFPEDLTRTVMWFSHSEHLQRRHPETGKLFDCLQCHVVRKGDGFEVRIPEEVRNCTQCHGHESHPEQTGGFTLEEVSSCVQCHRLSPIPERGVPVQVERLRVARKVGVETHDRGGACNDCHQMAPADASQGVALRETPTVRTVQGTRRFHIHQEQNPQFPENRFFNQEGPNRQYCVDCHWQSQEHQWRRSSEFEKEPYFERGLSATKLRKKLGNVMAGFPGFRE